MTESAAFLTAEVLPKKPLRQWVLSLPFARRFLQGAGAAAGDVGNVVLNRVLAAHPRARTGATLGVGKVPFCMYFFLPEKRVPVWRSVPDARAGCCAALFASLLSGCALLQPPDLDPAPLEAGRLPAPDITVRLPQLGPCTDAPDQAFSLDSSKPVTVLVHGCNGSAGRFRSLAQLYAFHGQQAVCFNYDDRTSLVRSAAQLAAAVGALAGRMRNRDITVIGHSMGGLVARKAMEGEHRTEWERDGVNVAMVTVSAPISGIAVANPCGDRILHWASLGTVPLTCWAVTGDNWHEITASSDFIRRPGPLIASVRRYVKVVTDERDSCRRRDAAGACLESDYTFSLAEQYQPIIDEYPRLVNVQVAAGHMEIVGYKGVAPRLLVSILQQQGVLAATAAGREDALELLLARLY